MFLGNKMLADWCSLPCTLSSSDQMGFETTGCPTSLPGGLATGCNPLVQTFPPKTGPLWQGDLAIQGLQRLKQP